jgi:hypothetical protein
MEQILISNVERALNFKEKERLRELHELVSRTPWSRWSRGNHMKKVIADFSKNHLTSTPQFDTKDSKGKNNAPII